MTIRYFPLLLLAFFLTSCSNPYVVINDKKIDIVLADGPEEWKEGLQNVVSMSENSGMLFVFPEAKEVTFWMKDTKIPLDMIFIDETKVIQFIRKNVQPCSADPCQTYTYANTRYVLEVNGGFADKNDVKTGDKIIFQI